MASTHTSESAGISPFIVTSVLLSLIRTFCLSISITLAETICLLQVLLLTKKVVDESADFFDFGNSHALDKLSSF